MLLDEVGLEHKGLDLVVDDYKLKIRDDLNELPRLGVLVAARLKILPYAVAQVLGLTDIYDLARRVLVQVDPG